MRSDMWSFLHVAGQCAKERHELQLLRVRESKRPESRDRGPDWAARRRRRSCQNSVSVPAGLATARVSRSTAGSDMYRPSGERLRWHRPVRRMTSRSRPDLVSKEAPVGGESQLPGAAPVNGFQQAKGAVGCGNETNLPGTVALCHFHHNPLPVGCPVVWHEPRDVLICDTPGEMRRRVHGGVQLAARTDPCRPTMCTRRIFRPARSLRSLRTQRNLRSGASSVDGSRR